MPSAPAVVGRAAAPWSWSRRGSDTRLVYRPDAEGRLQPVLECGVPGHRRVAGYTQDAGSAVPTEGEERGDGARDDSGCWIDPEYHQHVAEEWELEPWRPHGPVALVVAVDPDARIRTEEVLRAEGYTVVTCSGPGTTRCEASRLGAASVRRCPRVPHGTIVLDAAAEDTRVPGAYAVWEPAAEVRHAP